MDAKPDINCAYTEQGCKCSVYVHNRDANILAHRNAGGFSCEAVVKIIWFEETDVAEQVFIKFSTLKFNGDLVTVFSLLFVYR